LLSRRTLTYVGESLLSDAPPDRALPWPIGPEAESRFWLMSPLLQLPRHEPEALDVYWRFKEELQVEAMLRVACLFSAARTLNSKDPVRCPPSFLPH
jgi:hypothetical protein